MPHTQMWHQHCCELTVDGTNCFGKLSHIDFCLVSITDSESQMLSSLIFSILVFFFFVFYIKYTILEGEELTDLPNVCAAA